MGAGTENEDHHQDQRELLSLKKAARALGDDISERTLRREIKAGRLKAMRARPGANSKLLIRADWLDEWVEDCAGRRFMGRGEGSVRNG
jgi:hypothetical protein